MAKKLWGGRFKKKIDSDFDDFQKSIYYDYKLAEYDIYHSMIHVWALLYTKVLTLVEAKNLHSALKNILKEIKERKFKYGESSEDIHTDIQNKLEERVGRVALKLHSFRSRNDQIVFDEKWYCLSKGFEIAKSIVKLTKSLTESANRFKKYLFVGYTHSQRAQVIKFSDYLFSFYLMFNRDRIRIDNFLKNLEIFTGSGAMAGSYIKKEDYNKAIKEFIKKQLSYNLPLKISLSKNPIDNVSNRDFIIEFLSILSILQMHLSRMAEDFILYSTKEFNFLDLPEEFCTGSSLMPHKKNPDFLELVRGYTGKIYGNLISLLVTMKSLPLTYNKDMQLDKEPLFASVEIIKSELKILAKFIKGIKLNKEVIEKALEDENLYATELAEYLVIKGTPFKKAHEIIGKLIRYSEEKNIKIKDMPDRLLKKFSLYLNTKEVKKRLNPDFSIKSKRSID